MTKEKMGMRPAHLLVGALLTLMLLALGSLAGGGGPVARAVDPVKVGLDANLATSNDNNNDGLYSTFDPAKAESCRTAALNEEFDIELFVLNLASGDNLAGFQADISYPGSLINVTRSVTVDTATVKLMVDYREPASDVWNASQNDPDANGILAPADNDGSYEAGSIDVGDLVGETGSGILARIRLKAVANGTATVTLSTADLNGDTVQDEGVVLADVDGGHPGDTTGDGFVDTYVNQSIIIGIGASANPDGDAIPTACGDNCPNNANDNQADMDFDALGDVCDPDKDADGFENTEEVGRGSNDAVAASKPEVCDRVGSISQDEDGDTLTNEGYDYDGNTIPDCQDPAKDTDGDTIVNTTDTNDDNDGLGTPANFSDMVENYIRTDSLQKCAGTTTPNDEWDDKWPPEATDDRTVDILDVLKFKPAFNAQPLPGVAGKAWRQRYDLNMDSKIDILDILKIKPYFGTTCVP